MDLPQLLTFAKRVGGSDLLISAGASVMVRVNGAVRPVATAAGGRAPPLLAEETRSLIYESLTDDQKKRLEQNRELDCAIALEHVGRFRANVFFQERGLGGVFRVIPTEIRTCDELSIPPVVRSFSDLEKGLVLVTGPTGSGKSTTLAALIDRVNATHQGHIITVEDPIEFVHAPKRCMVNQREVGSHTLGFANALRAALREAPDVILVGEMRDLDTIALAITAAETGHLVFGTLHTSSTAKTADRIINVFPAGEQSQIRAMLADSLQAVVAQTLVPKRGGGRVAAYEILVATSAVRAMIRDGKTHQLISVLQTGARHGMQSLEQALTALVVQGIVDREVVNEKLASLFVDREERPAPPLAARTAPPAGAAPVVEGTRTVRPDVRALDASRRPLEGPSAGAGDQSRPRFGRG